MAKTPYKMKYTNGKKADITAFPFKAEASPAKFMNAANVAGTVGRIGSGGGGGGGGGLDERTGLKKQGSGGGDRGGIMQRLRTIMRRKIGAKAERKVEEVIESSGDEGAGDGLE